MMRIGHEYPERLTVLLFCYHCLLPLVFFFIFVSLFGFLSVFFFFLCIFLFYFFSPNGILFSLLIINLHLFVSRIFGCFVPPRLGELRLLKLVETSLNLFFFYLCLRLSAVSWDMTMSRSCSFPGTHMWHLEGASLEGASYFLSFNQVGNPTRLPKPFPLQKSEQASFNGWKLQGAGNPCSF